MGIKQFIMHNLIAMHFLLFKRRNTQSHQGTYLRHLPKVICSFIFCTDFAYISYFDGRKINQTGAEMLAELHPVALAFPLLLTLQALVEEPPQTEDNHQLTRYNK